MKTTVVYHSADFDGIFCREIARKFLPEAELIGWDFADEPLAIPEGKIYVLDLPVDRVFGINIANAWAGCFGADTDLIWIDHHKSSIESHPTDIPGYRVDGVAACRLAWQWFRREAHVDIKDRTPPLPDKDNYIARQVVEPLAVRLAGEYDIWDHRGDGDLEFQFGLRGEDLEATGAWAQMLALDDTAERRTMEIVRNGKLLQTYQERIDASTMRRSFLVNFEGLKFLTVTTARCNSLSFAAKDVPETGHNALMGIWFDGEKWNVSLYHARHRKDLDLSQIAVKYGGGGHRGACGFAADHLPFLK